MSLAVRRTKSKSKHVHSSPIPPLPKVNPRSTDCDRDIHVPEVAIFLFDEELALQEHRLKHAAPVFAEGRERKLE